MNKTYKKIVFESKEKEIDNDFNADKPFYEGESNSNTLFPTVKKINLNVPKKGKKNNKKEIKNAKNENKKIPVKNINSTQSKKNEDSTINFNT